MFILTFVILVASNQSVHTAEHSSLAACQAAVVHKREQLATGKVILATCDPK